MRCESGTGPLHNGPQCEREAKWAAPLNHPRFVCDMHRFEFFTYYDPVSRKWIPGVWEPLERQEELI